ncbi:MAG: Holliday junction resolvase RuvX [Clostridiales bacterium]|nr:Holliday junction resolvase RuvX [Clostridiales bacterium]
MRILAMDVGDRRIGMAISDSLGLMAHGIETLVRKGEKHDMERIGQIIDIYKPDKMVLGLPINMNGTIGPQSEKVKKFGDLIKEHGFTGDIIYWDERLTSMQANRIMIDADVSRKKRKENVDMMAAIFILQGYLDFTNNKKRGGN